ncbi:MAG: transglutaminase-like domain-containing protein [Isosphaeraceae bacterium]
MLALLLALGITTAPDSPAWWDAAVSASLDRVPEKRDAWQAMLQKTPPAERPGMAYLVTYLPLRDLKSLDPAALAENVSLAYQARNAVPWGKSLPEPVFLDAVLPHASLTEPRQPMRAEFFQKYLSLVKDCQTPGDAAQKLNRALFRDYKVTYNTRRLRTDQASKESIAQGMATCTGLSIMLVEACRAVGVPARVAGIGSWPGRGGNHTWTEVWNDGWHFVGAAEPDDKGLDHAWFNGDAAKAIKAERRNAIWASSYKPTGETFPLAWNPYAEIPGENVTDRYTGKAATAAAPTQPPDGGGPPRR